jgi:hypothetical protein
MSAIPPIHTHGMDRLKKGVRYQIIRANGDILGTGIFDRRTEIFGEPFPGGVFHSMQGTPGIGRLGFNPGERIISSYYYTYRPVAYSGGGRRRRRTSKQHRHRHSHRQSTRRV